MYFFFRGSRRNSRGNVLDDSSSDEDVGNVPDVDIPDVELPPPEINNDDINDNDNDNDNVIDNDNNNGNNGHNNINNINNNNNNNNNNEINLTLNDIRDSIIAKNTLRSYVGDIVQLLDWVQTQDDLADWITDYGRAQLAAINIRNDNETNGRFKTRKALQILDLVRDSYNFPIININNITPDRYMEYIIQLRAPRKRYLSPSAYGNKRSAFYHLFRLHNRNGFPPDFRQHLGNLFRGFKREVVLANQAQNNNEDDDNNNHNMKEGKEPMSVELYKKLLEWFLKYNTVDGMFAHCFLVLSWNLACRVGNTSRIAFRHITWNQSFDSFSIAFSQTKTDQYGQEAKYPRHLYSNPLNPLVCPVLSLSLYLSSCFNTLQNSDNKLFPGPKQAQRFSTILYKAIDDNWETVSNMGYIRGELGTHSIRKGPVSYLSSLPGGPSDAAVCIRAGWTKGKIRDIYMRYVSSGDEFVGRCICLLSILKEDFAVSPPHFRTEDFDWIGPLSRLQYPMLADIVCLRKVTSMCLASILYHNGWLSSFLHPSHVLFTTAYCFRSNEVLSHEADVVVTYPWNDGNGNVFTGIPPTIALLQQVCLVRDKQQVMVAEFVAEVSELLRDRLDQGRVTEAGLLTILQDFERRFTAVLEERAGAPPVPALDEANDRPEAGRRYNVHFYGGGIHRLPQDWRFPRCGVFGLWRQWMIGDDVRNVPPLRDLHPREYKHIDVLPLSEEERHGRCGGHAERRRPSRKILCDMRYLMRFISNKITERGVYQPEITPSSVDAMFMDVVDCFTEVERDAQKNWTSAVQSLRRRLHDNNDEEDG